MIPQSFIEELKMNSDIESVISSYVQLRKRGRISTGLCPFHSEKTPSFSVSADKQIYHCFGCGKGGGESGTDCTGHSKSSCSCSQGRCQGVCCRSQGDYRRSQRTGCGNRCRRLGCRGYHHRYHACGIDRGFLLRHLLFQ